MNARLNWRDDAAVELVPGYALADTDGTARAEVAGVRVAVEGGYLHVAVPGVADIQVVSAPAVRRIRYPRAPEPTDD
ncbi:hypothetical protein [Kitasatospora sp. A2-31]|uniref:hypothetical protein n=1 Tax=Kitasatospora sp. A2-31 TaxID=2916414 RepID=UPI001EEDB304|nr:hypothetical protein [Kitasatospora sp. A2-31]MCG6498771.1 hypothetical protein [Kitasatospora sp. A2-31]